MKTATLKHLLLSSLVLLLLLAACGGAGTATEAPAAATTAPATNTPVPPTATPIPPTPTPVPPTATPTPMPTEEAQPAATATTAAEATDNAVISKQLSDLFDSYRSTTTYQLETTYPDGTTQTESVTMTSSWVKADNAYGYNTQVDMSNLAAGSEGGPQNMSIYAVDDMAYINVGGEWLSTSRGQEQDMVPLFFNAEDFTAGMGGLDTMQRKGKEKLNGIDTIHYVFNKADLLPGLLQGLENGDQGTVESYEGDVWIAADGNYIVKMEIHATVKDVPQTDDSGNQQLTKQALALTFEVRDINTDITIELPADAPQPGAVEVPGFAPGEFPMPAETTMTASMAGIVQLHSTLSQDEVNSFYDDELAALGWQKQEGFMPTWTKDDVTISIFMTPADNGGVDIMITGQ